jgi:hypothetical protein
MEGLQAHKDAITSIVATTALTSPLWLPSLDVIAKVCAIVYSILGAVWLSTQIYRAWKK